MELQIYFKVCYFIRFNSVKIEKFSARFITNTKKIKNILYWILGSYIPTMVCLNISFNASLYKPKFFYFIFLHSKLSPKKFWFVQNLAFCNCSSYRAPSQKGIKNIVAFEGNNLPPLDKKLH